MNYGFSAAAIEDRASCFDQIVDLEIATRHCIGSSENNEALTLHSLLNFSNSEAR